MAGAQLGAMCAALAEPAGLGQELHGEGSSFRQVSGCLRWAEASAAAPALGSPPTRCGHCLAAGTAPDSPEPFAVQASLARARTERRREGGKLRERGGSATSISAPSGAGLRERGGTGQRRVRGARTGEDGGENKGPSAPSAALCPARAAARRSHFASPALPCLPILGGFFHKGVLQRFRTPVSGQRARGGRGL